MSQMERIKVLAAITQRGFGRELVSWMSQKGMGYQLRFVGKGTASSEMLGILGLDSSDKDIIISLGKQSAVESVARAYMDNMNSLRRGRGIMMMFSPNALSNVAASILAMQKIQETEEDNEPMKTEHKYSLILIAVNQGYTDAVMQSARQAGATGGTIIRARLASDEAAEQFHGFNLHSEKEIVAILAADTIKENIMNTVNAEFGLKSEAQGLVLSMPVEKAFKI